MISPLDLSLINGPIPVTATVAGVLALVALAIRKNRTWRTRTVLDLTGQVMEPVYLPNVTPRQGFRLAARVIGRS